MNTSPQLITATGLCMHYGDDQVLDDIHFSLTEKEIVTILGPNGSGKSTFIRLLIRALKPSSGRVEHRQGLRIGYVPQRLGIDANLPMTVDRFLRLGMQCDDAFMRKWVNKVGVDRWLDSQVAHLSGGQLQRAMLAQALMTNPHVLILDEATQGLDQQGEAAFYRLIDQVRNEQACAVVLVSHDLHVVMSASDRVICLNGHVCCEGTPTIVSAAPEYRALFGVGTEGALALYRHEHDHSHDHNHSHSHSDNNAPAGSADSEQTRDKSQEHA